MRKLQIIALGICLLACACRSTNKLTDKDGNKYAVKEFANYLWITTNLQVNTAQSYCYADSNTYCQKYGRLYTWSAAQQACAAFGNGWRLPAQEEWQQLNAVYGNGPTDSITTRRAAYPVLLNGGSSGLMQYWVVAAMSKVVTPALMPTAFTGLQQKKKIAWLYIIILRQALKRCLNSMRAKSQGLFRCGV